MEAPMPDADPRSLPASPMQREKLPGLPYIILAKNIERQRLAKDLGVDARRVYALAGVQNRAEPWEINKLMELLHVTYDELVTVPPDAPELPTRRRPKPPIAARTIESLPPEPFVHSCTESDSGTETVDSVPPRPTDIALRIILPDNRHYEISSNRPVTIDVFQRMARALYLLIPDAETPA